MKNGFFSFLDSRGKNDPSGEYLPWLDTPSIYDHILRNLDPLTGKLLEEGWNLPDEERRFSGHKFRWMHGSLDSVISHHTGPEQVAVARLVSQNILEISNHDSPKAKIALYKILLQDELLEFIDEALQEIAILLVQPRRKLHEFARFLARTAPDRGPVKFAIALIGIIHDPGDLPLITLLGCHDEFTLYSVVALANMLEDPEPELWKLAQKVDGWGRIHVVEGLAKTTSPEIKNWLLREGYQNSVMNEYLAYTCAVGGDLRSALSAPEVDDDLLLAAGEIIEALITDGPAANIKGYLDAAEVILRYLQLLDERANTVAQYLTANAILGYLTMDWFMNINPGIGWNSENHDQAILLANQILQRPFWQELVEKGLKAKDDKQFYQAARAADLLGKSAWDFHWTRLAEKPLDSSRWFYVMRKANKERIDQILQLAMESLPLDLVATGPSDELGLSPAYQIHQCLENIVEDLDLFVGKGWPLIAASLKSPVIRNRNMGLKVLGAWGKENWPEEAEPALSEAELIEPDLDVKKRMNLLLKG